MKKILQRFVALPIVTLLVASAAGLAVVPNTVHAETAKQAACRAINDGSNCDQKNAETRINNTVKNVTDIFSVVVGLTAVLMIIVGGFKYVTSSGDSSKITSAKNTILYAVIGLVVVALAQFIVRFVLGSV